MKKFIYISFAVVGLLVVSCTKETIAPNAVSSPNEKGLFLKSSDTFSDDENIGTTPITDPNSDRDENSRKRN
jgi:hypothetical protein